LFSFFYLCVYNSCSVILVRVVLLMIFFRFWRAAMALQVVLKTIVTSSVAVGIPLVPLLLNVKHLVRVCHYIWGMHEMLTIMLSVVILLKLFMLPNECLNYIVMKKTKFNLIVQSSLKYTSLSVRIFWDFVEVFYNSHNSNFKYVNTIGQSIR